MEYGWNLTYYRIYVNICSQKSEKRILNGGEYDISWDYHRDSAECAEDSSITPQEKALNWTWCVAFKFVIDINYSLVVFLPRLLLNDSNVPQRWRGEVKTPLGYSKTRIWTSIAEKCDQPLYPFG